MTISRYHLFFVLLCCIGLSFFAGCTGVEKINGPSPQQDQRVTGQENSENTGLSWMTYSITDAVTGKKTSVAELAEEGRPIIIHTFAVWCPACSIQLKETAKIVLSSPDTYHVLGIDLDPRENTDMVKKHIEKNQFVGMYVAAPPEMTRSMINAFGTQIVQSLPQTIVICNKSVTYIGDGVFPEANLKKIISEVC